VQIASECRGEDPLHGNEHAEDEVTAWRSVEAGPEIANQTRIFFAAQNPILNTLILWIFLKYLV
jgi:hypothetical protein